MEWSSNTTLIFNSLRVICQLDERSILIIRSIEQSTRDDMSGNWNGEILDMDEGKRKTINSFSCLYNDEKEKNGFWLFLMNIFADFLLLMFMMIQLVKEKHARLLRILS